MYTYPFEKLVVWQILKRLAIRIYSITRGFPSDEKFGLVNQMRRAAVSVSSNIAEGNGRTTSKDQAYFYNNAYSSLMELLNQLLISNELGWVDEKTLAEVREEIETISVKINALRKSILKSE